ncbi:hypothetical protein B0181_09980 [Moraxella caviae]|uniref:Toxin-antitoxin system HicB family antitoxin n=1 Tax=Moraxella caviae TaxID=34060 RepID=A0A1S9ZXG0_9GAMM|nr:hypothetical protein [Moraxella caviae]OOR87641.1 hypothetical protein B0181_09980 [Moraxella caviae]STZ10097.1 Uncharacterised protein [Moraxella caviae]VEW12732.1 Uncharacterised protein [Moraxella caviae]
MSNIQLQIPNSLYRNVLAMAQADDTSVNEFINRAIAEKLMQMRNDSSVEQAYLKHRANKASRTDFEQVLAKVANITPAAEDRL